MTPVITPIDFAENLGLVKKKIFRFFKRKNWTPIKLKKDSLFVSLGYATTDKESGKTLLNILTLPNPDVMDETISLNPSFVPKAVLTKFETEDGKSWKRTQHVFHFDDARRNKIKKVMANVMEHAVVDTYAHDDNVNNGFVTTPWEKLSRTIKDFKKGKPIIVK